MEVFTLAASLFSLLISIIVIWSIISIANSNVRIRKAVEQILEELQKHSDNENLSEIERKARTYDASQK